MKSSHSDRPSVTPEAGIPDIFLPRGWLSAVGFLRVDGILRVSFPKVYDVWRDRLQLDAGLRTRHLVLLVRVLAKYTRTTQYQSALFAGMILQRNPGMLDWLEAACEIYDDYQESGLYWIKRDKLSARVATGSIAWGPTLSSTSAYLVEGVPVHLEAVRRTRSRSADDLLHRLHATVVDEVVKLFGGRTPIADQDRMTSGEMDAVMSNSKSTFASLARSTFSDRGKRLLALVQRYLQLAGGQHAQFATGQLMCSSDAFELIWEHMLRVTMGEGAPIGIPAGTWRRNDGSVVKGIAPRPDFTFQTFVDEQERVAIFDAKDKIINSDGRTGSEQDHYKQIAYRSLGNIATPIWNALLFPSLGLGADEEPFTRLGSHSWNSHPLTLVHEIAVDYPTVCTAFLSRRRLDPTPFLSKLDVA